MAVLLVTYELKPSRDYRPLYDYLRRHTHCHSREPFWLLDTWLTPGQVAEAIGTLIDPDDICFVARVRREWAGPRHPCATWLREPGRNW